MIDKCKACDTTLLSASAELHSFDVDSEPYTAGVIEPAEEGELIIDDCYIAVTILWCAHCHKIREAWITGGIEEEINNGYSTHTE